MCFQFLQNWVVNSTFIISHIQKWQLSAVASPWIAQKVGGLSHYRPWWLDRTTHMQRHRQNWPSLRRTDLHLLFGRFNVERMRSCLCFQPKSSLYNSNSELCPRTILILSNGGESVYRKAFVGGRQPWKPLLWAQRLSTN